MIEILLEAERALTVGLTDRAEKLYRQAIENDPHNSIAVVGLARVALERGDDTGALELARRALGIDPENDAARRTVARLEEVLARRADETQPPATPAPAASPGAPASEGSQPAARATPRRRRGIVGRLLGRR
jgi:tetratricopeptide (TPR) repeat protein